MAISEHWYTGINVRLTERGWTAELNFFDDASGAHPTASRPVSTEGTLRTRYAVTSYTGDDAEALNAAVHEVLADATRMGLRYYRINRDEPTIPLYVDGTGWTVSGIPDAYTGSIPENHARDMVRACQANLLPPTNPVTVPLHSNDDQEIDPIHNRLLGLDVETTGLDADIEHLLQVSAQVLDTLGNPLTSMYSAIVRYTPEQVATMKAACNPYVLDMHTKTGLWDRLTSAEAKPLDQIDQELAALVTGTAPEVRQARVMGNSVVLDLNFTQRFLPTTYARLHYRFIDVTGIGTFHTFTGLTCKRPKKAVQEGIHDADVDVTNATYELQVLAKLDQWIAAQIAAGRLDTTGVDADVLDLVSHLLPKE